MGLSREMLARRADVSTSMIVRLELHGNVPKVPALLRIVDALDVQLDDLLNDDEATP